MKTNVNGNQNPTKGQANNQQRPENKDNLDSREGEEQLTKGDDVTHNKKEKKNEPKSNASGNKN